MPTPTAELDLFELAFRHAAIGMAIVGVDGRWLKVNDALCRLVGYRRDELLALDFQSITHPDDLDADLALVKRLVAGEIETFDLEKRYLSKHGEVLWVLLTVTLARDAVGAPRFFIAQIQDVSRRRLAESNVARFFATSPDLLAIIGGRGRLELASPAWGRVLGWSPEELLAMELLELVHPDDRARALAEAARLRDRGREEVFRARCRHRDGHYVWLEWHTSVGEDGRLFCVVRDVHQQVAAARHGEWLAAIVEHSADAVLGLDADGKIFSANPGAEALYGYSAAEFLGQPLTFLARADATRAEIEGVWKRALEGVPLQEYDAIRQRKDGSSIDVHVHVRRVEDGQGGVLGWSITMRDITERQRLTAALAYQANIYAGIARSLPRGAVTVFDRDLHVIAIEGAELLAAFGTSRWELIGRSLLDISAPENRARLEGSYRRALAGESTETMIERSGLHLLVRTAPLHDRLGAITGGLVLSLDVSELRQRTEELRQAKLLLDAIIANMPDGVVLLDAQRRILLANDAFASSFGLERARLPGMFGYDFIALVRDRFVEADRERLTTRLDVPLREPAVDELALLPPDGRTLRRTIKPVGGDASGGFLIVWHDITAERDLLARRDREALTDVLTGVANRRAAEAALRGALASAARTGQSISVVLFDIDHFKRINDAYGHATGDQVIKAVANLLAGQARATDTVARWGGEEFIAVLGGGRAAAALFAGRVLSAVRALVVAEVGPVTISAGIAESKSGEGSLADLVARADARLYEAKSAGRDRAAG
jgi:diguanylate cyclase (GGDEF)-like protein/PAS domain S-box-containing protein